MKRYVEIPIGRLWRLTVTTTDVQTEYIVADAWLAPMVDSITAEQDIRDIQCVPYHSGADHGAWARKVWTTSRAPVGPQPERAWPNRRARSTGQGPLPAGRVIATPRTFLGAT